MTQKDPPGYLLREKSLAASKARFCLELWNLPDTALLARFQNPACRLREECVSNATLLHFAIDELHVSVGRYLSLIFYKKAEEGVCFLSPDTLK